MTASPEPTPGLRETIEKFVGTAYPNNGEGHTDKLTWTVPERAFGDLRRALAASPVPEPDGETETCPTCWQPVPVPQRGDHDYGIPLAAPEPTGLDADRLAVSKRDLAEAVKVVYYGGGQTLGNMFEDADELWTVLAARLTGEGS